MRGGWWGMVALAIGQPWIACVGDSTNGADSGTDATTNDAPMTDSASDVASDATPEAGAACDLVKDFGKPVAIAELNTANTDAFARLTHDELTIYWESIVAVDAGGVGAVDLVTATRANATSTWGSKSLLAVNGPADDNEPSPTGDDLTLYFSSDRNPDGGAAANAHLWAASRTTTVGAFANPTELTVNSSGIDWQPYVMPDGLTLYFASTRSGVNALYRATRPSNGSFTVDASGVLDLVNKNDTALGWPVVTLDELTLYFNTNLAGGSGAGDIWIAHRASKSDPFGAPTNLAGINTSASDAPTWISDDGCRLYLSNDSSGSLDLYVATKPK